MEIASRITDQYQTEAGIPVKNLYTPEDLAHFDPDADLGEPGDPPYTRGIHPGMYRERPWTVRQLAGFSTPEHTNRRLKMLLDQGATGVNTIFDYVTNRGYDSDFPLAEGDVGQGGVAIESLDDMANLYEGVPIDEVSVSIVLSHPIAAGVIFAMYLAVAEQRGIPFSALRGTLQNDFMMETVILTAPNILHPRFSFRLSMDVVEYCIENVPKWNPISFTGYNYREAGANAVQEAAFVVTHALESIEELERRGHSVDEVAPRLSAFFTADNDFFEEIAKYRAARRVYHRLVTERYSPADPRSSRLRFHVQTSGSALTAQQPLNNIARASYHGLAAVLGGAQSLHVSAYDEALCVPSEAAAVTALRTQQIMIEETGVTKTADPLAGSYYLESLTTEMEQRIIEEIGRVDALGGLVSAVEQGWVHEEIIGTAYRREIAILRGERRVVGVNCHTESPDADVDVFRVPDALTRQRQQLQHLRQTRDHAAVRRALQSLRDAASGDENVIPHLLEAVKANATLGECCEVFRQLHGSWKQPLL